MTCYRFVYRCSFNLISNKYVYGSRDGVAKQMKRVTQRAWVSLSIFFLLHCVSIAVGAKESPKSYFSLKVKVGPPLYSFYEIKDQYITQIMFSNC